MYTEEKWLSIFSRWEVSSLPQQEFCEAEGVSYSQFARKRAELLGRGLIADRKTRPLPKQKTAPMFVPVEVSGASASKADCHSMIEIQLPHGIILRIPTHVAV